MPTFTCPDCSMHEYDSVPDGRGHTIGVCLGRVPYVPPPGAPGDLPATTVACGFTWDRADDGSLFGGP